MKKSLLMKTMLLLCALIVGSSAWAAEGDTHVFVQTLQQLLNNNASIDDITIDAQSYPIKKVIVSYRYNKTLTNAVTVEVSVGGTSWGSSNVVGTGSNYTTMEFTGTEATGEVVISFTNNTGNGTGHGTFYVNNVTLTEGNSADPGKTDVALTFAEDSYEADYNGGVGTFSAPTLTKSADVAVSYTSTDESVATVNETSGAITLKGKGTTTIRASFAGDATYNSASAAYELTVVDNKRYTVSEAFTIIDSGTATQKAGVYVRGVISKIDNVNTSTGKATYWISSNGSTSGQQLEAYNGKYINNVGFTSADQITVGDRVVIYGNLTKYGSTYEFAADNYLISVTPDTRTAVNMSTFTATETDLIVGDIQATSVTNDQAGWAAAYTYSSDDESIATIAADGKITAVAKGTTKVWAILNVDDEDDDYKVGITDRKSIDITVHNPSHTAQFSINGVIDNGNDDTVEEGEAIAFPTDPTSINGKSFVGWTTSAIVGTQDSAPATLVTSANMGNVDIIDDAVFAVAGSGNVNASLTITKDTENFPDAYGTANKFTEYSLEGKTFKIQQAYVNGTKLQWRAAGNSNGTGTMYNTEALDNIQSIVLTYDSSDGYKNFSLKVGNEENPTSGTTITPSADNLVYTFDCSASDYDYFVLANGSNAGYLASIKINYQITGTVYSAYCTTVTQSKTVESYGWATYIPVFNVEFEANTAFVVTDASVSTGLTLEEVTQVPAGTPLLLKGAGEKTATVIASATAPSTNLLSISDGSALATGKYAYVLAKNGEGACFKQWTGDASVLEGRVVLILDEAVASARTICELDDDVTAIEAVKAKNVENGQFFNLAGQRVAQPTKGLYIVNGKKVIIK